MKKYNVSVMTFCIFGGFMKRFFALFLCLLCLLSAVSCADQPGTSDGETSGNANQGGGAASDAATTEEAVPDSPEFLEIVKGGVAQIPLVVASRASGAEEAASAAFFEQIFTLTGAFPESYPDYEDPVASEILIGSTTRPESVALQETLKPYSFAIEVTATHLVIVAYDGVALSEGVTYFFSTFLQSENCVVGDGELKLKVGAKYVSDGSDNSAFWESLLASDTLVAGFTEEILEMPDPSGTTWPQGGCIKDGCYYQAFIRKDTASNEVNNTVHIVKYDLKTKKLLQTSPVLDLNHCNDITYNPKRGVFVVCHNNPYRTKLSFVDPETLEVVGTKTIGDKIYSIDYNEERDCYVVGLSGGQSFTFLDSNFVATGTVYAPTPRTKGYTTQGVTSDGQYIYFVLYNSNVITVYDWKGNFVTLIELDLGKIEPENLAIVRNEIYISCGTSGKAVLFKVGGFVPKSGE